MTTCSQSHQSFLRLALPLAFSLTVTSCGASSARFTSSPDTDLDRQSPGSHQLTGIASYYADEFHGRKTANGEVYDMNDLTAAHRTLPFNTTVMVRNLDNMRTVVVRINDRGPFKKNRVIDLSLRAANQVGLIAQGTASVELEIIELGQ